jgi:hypothetical protein
MPRIEVEEAFQQAKAADGSGCEDAVVDVPGFVGVVDGATNQGDFDWLERTGLTGGAVAAQAIKSAVARLPRDATLGMALEALTRAVRGCYESVGILELVESNPVERIAASFALFAQEHDELWLVGDCQALLVANDQPLEVIRNAKQIDAITATARAAFLEAEVASGKTEDQLRQHDSGRAFIVPLLRQQRWFQNSRDVPELCYWVIDGFPLTKDDARVVRRPAACDRIVLATDGYPVLLPTREQSDRELRKLIDQDPLMYQVFKTTKGVAAQGADSFDDRAYVSIKIHR